MVTAWHWMHAEFAVRKAIARTGRMLSAGTVARPSMCRRSGIRAGAILSAWRRTLMAESYLFIFRGSRKLGKEILDRRTPQGGGLQRAAFNSLFLESMPDSF